jgi:hypothetical protein
MATHYVLEVKDDKRPLPPTEFCTHTVSEAKGDKQPLPPAEVQTIIGMLLLFVVASFKVFI